MTAEKPTFLTKGQVIYEYIRDAISDGTYRPGEHLVLRQIAAQLGVSEIPVRDAINRLAAEGLVESRPHAGAVVTQLQRKDLEKLLDVRIVIDALAARFAAEHITEEELEQLRDLVTQMDACVQSGDTTTYGHLNRDFNRIVSGACDNPYLIEMINRLQLQTDRSRVLFTLVPSRLKKSNQEHRKIIELLEQKNGPAVEALVRRHRAAGVKDFFEALDRIEAEQAPAAKGADGEYTEVA